MSISLDNSLQDLAVEQKHTEINVKIFSYLFKDLGPLNSVVRITDKMLEDVDNAEDLIKYRVNQMAEEIIKSMKAKKLLNKKGELIK